MPQMELLSNFAYMLQMLDERWADSAAMHLQFRVAVLLLPTGGGALKEIFDSSLVDGDAAR